MGADKACHMCGNCCHFEIPLTLLDVARLSRFLKREDETVFREVVQEGMSRQSGLLRIRKRPSGACVFLSDRQVCTVHEKKPGACRLFVCSLQPESRLGVMPWTANCMRPSDRSALREQSVAAAVTRSYVRKHGTRWHEGAYRRAVEFIEGNVKMHVIGSLRQAGAEDGIPMTLLYDCRGCRSRVDCAREVPVTLDDMRRLKDFLEVGWGALFRNVVETEEDGKTGCFKLARGRHCVFFDEAAGCLVAAARPMQCQFAPCLDRTDTARTADWLLIGSRTVFKRFRHQAAMTLTRRYIEQNGVEYVRDHIERSLKELDRRVLNPTALERFRRLTAPFRYMNDSSGRAAEGTRTAKAGHSGIRRDQTVDPATL